jgi:hypothetical protein
MPPISDLTERMAAERLILAKKLDGTYDNARSKRVNIWSAILEMEIASGSYFLLSVPEQVPYLVVGLTRETYAIPRAGKGGDRFWAYMDRRYGMSEQEGNDSISRYVLGKMRNYATQHGARVEVRRFSAFRSTPEKETVYISGYNGSMWRIDGENVMSISNGEDDIFFIDDDGGIGIEPQVEANGVFLDRLVNQISYAETGMGGMSSEQMKLAFTVWIFALVFPDLMPTKPLLILEGAPGAGKSAILQLLQCALLGESKAIILSRNKEDDFGVLLLRSPICVFDNLDAYIDWVPDAVCGYTTSGKWTKRKLFTDAEELTIKPHAFIAVASKNPASFRREDVADRCVILRLERRERFTRFSALEQAVKDLRPQLFGEYLYYVNKIVAEIRQGALKQQADENHRMADFASLARVVGKVLDWGESTVDNLLLAIQDEQGAFINEEDPLVELLHKWISYKPNGRSSIGREISLFSLFSELESLAQGSGIPFYKSPRVLVQKLRSPHIERDFIIQMIALDGNKSYRIWRKTDARLSSVPQSDPVDADDEREEPIVIKAASEE